MKHVYISPHLDDAVLSCGGAIHRQATAGEPVLVVTLIAADIEASAQLSPFAHQLHADWGGHPQPFKLRRAEDVAALTWLGAEAQHLVYYDAVYRRTPDGKWPYTDGKTLMGEVHPGDPLSGDGVQDMAHQLAYLIPLQPEQVLYAPLGVGCHVDHQIVHSAARCLLNIGYRLAFYEDYPYAEEAGATEKALAAAGASNCRTECIRLSPSDLAAKVTAIGYHQSQLSVLFGGSQAMPNRVWSFASTRSSDTPLAERIWWPT